METPYTEIEIYKKEHALTKNSFWENIEYREFDIACARMICYRKKSVVA